MSDVPPSERFDSTERYYAAHRPGYGEQTVSYLRDRFELDANARVLDLGCGAGQLTLPLAAHAGTVVAMDPNEEMLRFGRQRAAAWDVENVEWVVGSDAEVRAEMGPFRLTTMGRSFHWMDQERTLDRLRRATEPGGGVALVTDHEWLTKGRADWQAAVYDVVASFLDDLPQRVDPEAVTYDDPWSEKLATFGFTDVAEVSFAVEREWSVDGVVGYVLSLSFASPARFGDDVGAFKAALRDRLAEFDRETFTQRATVEVVAGERVVTDDVGAVD
ncbi:class I SAM-dependent methyltransferase [Halomarina rubra]|uniref:Class I SAM-dependent methyltransferase n=1 Tax=Halomarina rubra TaxID=2071873 RepID=A0ABD6B0L0_9EURY|nr:class I SAM-dependent methyltransferase [Halomarina rubra]